MPSPALEIRHRNLLEALCAAANSHRGFTFIDRTGCKTLSYAQLYRHACSVSGRLARLGIGVHSRVILILPSGADFAINYFAVMLLGGHPCVQASPRLQSATEQGVRQLQSLVELIQCDLIITTEAEKTAWGGGLDSVRVVLPLSPDIDSVPIPGTVVSDESTALIQATSGSTAAPKCIALTHRNVCANCEQIAQHGVFTAADKIVAWLPLFHDMGLIGTFLLPIYCGIDSVLMNASMFIRRPIAWLEALSQYGGTISFAPNFAFGLVGARVAADEVANLDLTAWRIAICGAERIEPNILRSFYAKVMPTGFKQGAIAPAYGLAEATLCATGLPLHAECIVDSAGAGPRDPAVPLGEKLTAGQIISCGAPVPGTTVKIFGEDNAELDNGVAGRICLSGPSVMLGYLQADGSVIRPTINGMLDTGDIGYLKNGHLFVVGRAKELIIIRGQNHFPTDFEAAASEIAALRRARVLAVGVPDSSGLSEELHVIVELPRTSDGSDKARMKEDVARQVAKRTGVLPAHVEFVSRKTLPLTTSGKLQRRAFREVYLAQQ